MNLDFGFDPVFAGYTLLLMVSGIATIALGFIKAAHQSTLARVINFAVGAGLLGYGLYLGFILQPGGAYFIFYYILILPIVLIINFVKALRVSKQEPTPIYTGAPPSMPGPFPAAGQGAPYATPQQQPAPYGQPGQPAPYGQQTPYGHPGQSAAPAHQQPGQPAPYGQPGQATTPPVPNPQNPTSPFGG